MINLNQYDYTSENWRADIFEKVLAVTKTTTKFELYLKTKKNIIFLPLLIHSLF